MILDRPHAIDRLSALPGFVRLAVVVAVLLLPLVLGINLVLEPERQAIRAARETLMVRQQELASGQFRVADYDHLRREAQVRDRFKERFEAWLPWGERMPEALAVAALAARAAGAVDLTFDREGPEKQGMPATEIAAGKNVVTAPILEIPVKIETRVTLRGVGLFTDTLLDSPRHSRLEELRIAPVPPERMAKIAVADPARLSLLVRVTLFARTPGKS
jgi:Tfp pilus assembly protein PilO